MGARYSGVEWSGVSMTRQQVYEKRRTGEAGEDGRREGGRGRKEGQETKGINSTTS